MTMAEVTELFPNRDKYTNNQNYVRYKKKRETRGWIHEG